MCRETPDGEKCQTTYFWRDVSVPVLSLCLCFLRFVCFCFVLFCMAFSKAVFDSNFGLSGFVFLSLWRFVSLLRACCSVMWFSPFSCFLWLLSLLVAFFFYSFCSLLSRASWGSVLFACDFFGGFLVAVFPGPYSTQLVLSSLQTLDPLTF